MISGFITIDEREAGKSTCPCKPTSTTDDHPIAHGSNPKRLIGLTQDGEIFTFAENNIELQDGDIDRVESVSPGVKANFWDDFVGDFRGNEWAGATFHGDWLFANVQTPGVTFAIRGPWREGGL